MPYKTRKMRTMRKSRRRFVSKKRVPRKAMAKVAKQVFHKLSENKVIKQNYRYLIYNRPDNVAWIDNVRDATAPIRALVQGSGTSNRIGAKITLRKLMYNFCLYPNVNLESATPLIVKMWVIHDKFAPNNASTQNIQDACKTASTTIGNILENNNTSSGFQRDLQDIFNPINKERFRVYTSREFKLGTSSAPNDNTVIWSFGNNDFKLYRRGKVNLLKYLPKTFRYIDNQTNTQMSKKIFVLWQVVNADGSVSTDDSGLVNVADGYDIQFEDN